MADVAPAIDGNAINWCECTYGCDAEHQPARLKCRADPLNHRRNDMEPEQYGELLDKCVEAKSDLVDALRAAIPYVPVKSDAYGQMLRALSKAEK